MATPQRQPAPADDRHFTEAPTDLDLFWEKYKRHLLAGIALVVVCGVVTGLWVLHRQHVEAGAQRAFALAASSDAWEAIIRDFPGSVQAANSRLLLAQAQRERGDLAASTKSYEDFLSVVPAGQPLEGLARIGLAENAVAAGKAQEARGLFREAADSLQGFGAQIALLAQAQQLLLEADGLPEARKVFEAVVSEFPNSPAAHAARAALEQIALVLPPPAPGS